MHWLRICLQVALVVFGILALTVGVMYGEFDETMFNANLL